MHNMSGTATLSSQKCVLQLRKTSARRDTYVEYFKYVFGYLVNHQSCMLLACSATQLHCVWRTGCEIPPVTRGEAKYSQSRCLQEIVGSLATTVIKTMNIDKYPQIMMP